MKVYPPRDIRPFVMYCVNGKPRSSLLIESTDSMIQEVDGKMMMGLSIYGVAVISGSLYSRFYGMFKI